MQPIQYLLLAILAAFVLIFAGALAIRRRG